MKIAHRRLLYIGAAALFLVIAPFVIFYAQGYRLDVRAWRLARTGGLAISSEPKRAEVMIDGVLRATTPRSVLTLLPGDYDLTIAKTGYQPWRDRVRVRPHTSTKIEAVLMPSVLDLVSLPIANMTSLAATDDGTKAAVLALTADGAQLGIYDDRRRTYRQLVTFQGDNIDGGEVRWSANNKFLAVLFRRGEMIILDSVNGTVVPLPSFPFSTVTQGWWDPQNDNFFYALANETLWKIDLFAGTATVLASPGIIDFGWHGNSLWIVRRAPDGSTIERLDSQLPNARQRVITVRPSVEKHLYVDADRVVVQHESTIALHDGNGLVLTDGRIDGQGVRSAIDDSGRFLLVTTSVEAWTINLPTSTFTILGRFGTIQGATWQPRSSVAIILHDGILTAISAVHPTASVGSFGPFEGAETLYSLNRQSIGIVSRHTALLANLEM